MEPYSEFIEHVKEIGLLESMGGILGWDQEVMMPPKGAPLRAEALAWLSSRSHEKLTDPRIGELLQLLEAEQLNPDQQANVREMRRAYNRATKLPSELVSDIARHSSLSMLSWQKARAEKDFSLYQEDLQKMVDLVIKKAEYIGYEGDLYDALLDEYESGLTVAQLDPLFAGLREELVPLVKAVAESGGDSEPEFVNGVEFSVPLQEQFGRKVAEKMLFDFEAGRMDTSTHPFTSGAGVNDVRWTTRWETHWPFSGLYAVMHEVGHGLYEQGLDPEHERTPRGQAVGLGMHESQSRLWENQIGRSSEFWNHWLPIFKDTYPEVADSVTVEDVYKAVNRVKPSFIRVEADEATYNLHIMVRYEIEKDVINGRLKIEDLPAAWNAKMEDYLGVTPPDDAVGVLQDIHWSMGAFGYFPTYTLGNLYSAQIFEAAIEAIPDVWDNVATGEYEPLLSWLREKVHARGSLMMPHDLIKEITGCEPTSEPFLKYLKEKVSNLYKL